MNQTILRIMLCAAMFVAAGIHTYGQSPRITGIGGYNAGESVANGRWTGQPSNAPRSASDQFKGFLAIDTWGSNSSSASTWTITGTGFGSTRGTVSLEPGFLGPLPFSVVSILNWSNTQIQIRVGGFWGITYYRNVKIAVRTSSGATTNRVENLVAVPKGRGYGQCTWEVFYRRKAANLEPPPTAYPANRTSINATYVPRQWDVLFWGTGHTGIITTAPKVTRSSDGKATTYRFTLTERNAGWDEAVSTRTSEFIVKNGAVTQGILSNINKTANTYWR